MTNANKNGHARIRTSDKGNELLALGGEKSEDEIAIIPNG
jgi:hypothetical protein